MIRNFELFCNLNRIGSDDLSLLTLAIRSFNPGRITCPACGAAYSCSLHSHYQRDFISFSKQDVSIDSVPIPRLICSSCGHTHAFLPGILIPHASYSLFFILKVLRAYFLKTDTVAAICQFASIAISTLYRWLQLFFLHKRLWLGILKDHSTSNRDFLKQIAYQPLFPELFFSHFQFSFLQAFRPQRIRIAADP